MRDKIEHAIQNQPCTVKELKQKFGGERGADRKVMEALDELVREAVVCQRQGVFFTVRSGRADKALLCKVVKLGKNFAFVMLEDGTSDIFIPGRFTKGAMPGDDVLVEKFEHPRVEGSDEGAILAILTEKNDLVGTVRRVEGRLRFVPDDCPAISMQLMRDCEGGAKDGDKVAVEILNRGNRQEDHRVGVAMRFGSSDEAKRCAKALLYAKDIRTRFPDKVRDEAKKFEGAEVSEKDCEGRMDLRALPIFTIDSAETKDIDDAISLTRTSDGGFELGVHIADVSNYVKPGTELDNEAFSRATSVYYADQVVPMLPKALSNGICSLNENELRLAFSCLMRLDKDGGLTDYRFVKSIIRSRVKGVYSEINALLAGTADAEIKAKYADVIDQLPAMKELYGHRARLRKERGCMDIESGEVKLILDENGRCIDVKKRTSGESESMIEEFMLLANQCAAHFARVKQIPFVYRVHEEPNAEKLERLHALLQACGINDHFAKDVPTPKELSAILEGVRGTPYEQIINTGMLRCMSKALYEEKPKGHYGLVLKDYAHFTSPIRRYPDLAIHRIMTDMLKGTEKETMILRYTDFAERASKQSSEREVIAMQIERKAEDCYKAEYARRHLGECYEGTISGVTQRGLFIELDNGVEGFVPASSLTPSGTSLTEGVRLTDPASGKTWSLGDKMMITIVRADVNLGKIDFEVAPRRQSLRRGEYEHPSCTAR
jgi:ribonuclease R